MKCEIKYAPTNLSEVIYPNNATKLRIEGYASGQLEGHVMLHGPNGTGKTTVAKLLVHAIGGEEASLETKSYDELLGMNDLRSYLLQAGALSNLTTSGKHFLLLNEFDNAKKGVDKLWTALDDCDGRVMVIITTNEPMQIHKSVRSRCDVIEMQGITAQAALPRVQHALRAEGVMLSDAQVLYYLKAKEHWLDWRKYMREADTLLYMYRNNFVMPAWSGSQPTLKIVQ